MTSLTDVYEGRVGRVASRRQQLFGSGLFLAGAAMLVGAIGVATTDIGTAALSEYAAREVGGILAGIGLQTVLLGVFALLPASRRVRGAAVIGTGVALLGVALFRHVYPYQWVEAAPLLALATTAIYCFGVVTTFWCLFVGLATFKTRNDPGGTARMEVTQEGTIRLVEEARSMPGMGGVGLFGKNPHGSVETQTNRAGTQQGQSAGPQEQAPSRDPTPTADGGSATVQGDSTATNDPDGMAFDGAAAARGQPDTYCGNCEHFRYVRVDGELQPYCGLDEELMDDMDACDEWSANGP